MEARKKEIWSVVVLVVCIAIASMAYVHFGSQKADFHTDEYFTYQLANGYSPYWQIPTGQWFSPDLMVGQMVAREEALFRFDQVIEKEKTDMHPFLYTAIIHGVSSFFPNQFSQWIGIGVNIYFAAITMVLMYLIMRKLTQNSWVGVVSAIIWGISIGTVAQVEFIRMYVMIMCACTAVVFVHINWWGKEEKRSMYLWLYFVSLFGALTHYYFVMFLVMCCIVAFIRLLILKKTKSALAYLVTECLAGASAILIFPTMLKQVFSTGVGYSTTREIPYVEKLNTFLEIVNRECFGGLLWIIVGITVAVGLVLFIFKRTSTDESRFGEGWKYAFLFIPSVCSVMVISHISPYLDPRYVACVYPCILIAVLFLLNDILNKMGTKKTLNAVITLVIGVVITASGYMNGSIDTLYEYRQSVVSKAENRQGRQAVILIPDNGTWMIPSSLSELIDYDKLLVLEYSAMDTGDKDALESLQAPFNVYCCTWDTSEQRQEQTMNSIVEIVRNKQEVVTSYLWDAPYCRVYQCTQP